MLIKEVQTKYQFGGKWLGCERITMAPMQLKLVNKSLLTPKDINWINNYHKEVLSKLEPLLKKDERALKWLMKECIPI